MNLHPFKVSLSAAILALTIGCSIGSDPSGFSFRGLGWERNDNAGYVARLLLGSDNQPIGVSFNLLQVRPGRNFITFLEPAGPWPYTFLGIGWTLREKFGYSCKLLLGPDRSMVGISFRVWNNSEEIPLVLMKAPGAIPFSLTLRCEGEDVPRPRNKDPRHVESEKASEEWTLPPRGKEEFFVPIRDLLFAEFDPANGKECDIEATVMVRPKGMPVMMHSPFPSFRTPKMMITKTGLSTDLKAALKQASETADKPR